MTMEVFAQVLPDMQREACQVGPPKLGTELRVES
jgi:hypothetical protein